MSHVSSEDDRLPPREEAFSARLRAAMDRAGFESQRGLAKALGTEGSLVGKWLRAGTDGGAYPGRRHQRNLERVLSGAEVGEPRSAPDP